MQACQLGYLRQRAASITRWPLITSALFISSTGPAQLRSALTLNRFMALAASSDDPHVDSSAPWAIVKLAGIFVSRIDARAAGAKTAMKSAGFKTASPW